MVVLPGGAAGGADGVGSGAPAGSRGGGGGGAARVKGSWTPEEDDLLRRAVTRHGPRNWSVISAEIPGRSGKSCRLRWCNQLSPGVERRAFTPEEDALIVAAHAQYGNKWATIARMLHGRTDNSVKNHWNSTLRRHRRAAAAAANGGALPLRPLAAAAAAAAGPPPVPLRHLLADPKESSPASVVPFQPLDLKREDDGDEEEEDEDEDGSSEDSVLMAPPKKRPCLGAGHTHPSLAAVKQPEHTKPQPPTPPAPAAEPVTSLTLSLPGGGGGTVSETPALRGAATAAAVSSVDGAAKMRAKLEQDCPWLRPMIRQMICEEVQRLQGQSVACSLVAPPAGRAGAGAADGQD
ncbi:transcription factor MYB44-like [Panicum miliaceum]|uniref:Transcription factor MYB44-like n=1 Tax=Panicum miliaceum TaxID=4540 RepID=A0A3L6SZA5_PANMI|nr:transcription factor MYB44-like [Panicum miliaceum]